MKRRGFSCLPREVQPDAEAIERDLKAIRRRMRAEARKRRAKERQTDKARTQ